MARLLYNIFILLYRAGIRVASLWSPKAQKWIAGRTTLFATINHPLLTINSRVIWMHCASLGEFEQGRPLLESIRAADSNCTLVLTFFSPSGYEVIKDYKGVDHVFYLPMDNAFSAKRFIDAINPSLVLWVKYEYWLYYLQELKQRNIPVLLVSGVFRKSQPFFKWYGAIWKKMLQSFDHFFVQTKASATLLHSIGITQNITVSGDTRFDRVIEIAKQPLDLNIVRQFCKDNIIIVAGSTWEDDEVILAAYTDETHHEQKLIVVPHELDKTHIDSIRKMFKKSVCYSAIEKDPALLDGIDEYNTLIIDSIGMLSRLYRYGHINYIGGGFTNDGIHNILEAAVWGKPIIIGENYQKFIEAVDLIDCGAAESIEDAVEMKEVVDNWLKDTIAYEESAAAAKNYVYNHAGATQKIMDYIYTKRLLTN